MTATVASNSTTMFTITFTVAFASENAMTFTAVPTPTAVVAAIDANTFTITFQGTLATSQQPLITLNPQVILAGSFMSEGQGASRVLYAPSSPIHATPGAVTVATTQDTISIGTTATITGGGTTAQTLTLNNIVQGDQFTLTTNPVGGVSQTTGLINYSSTPATTADNIQKAFNAVFGTGVVTSVTPVSATKFTINFAVAQPALTFAAIPVTRILQGVANPIVVHVSLSPPETQNVAIQLVGPTDNKGNATTVLLFSGVISADVNGNRIFDFADYTPLNALPTTTYTTPLTPLGDLQNLAASGNWTLVVTNLSTNQADATINTWSLTLPVTTDLFAAPNPVNGMAYQLPYSGQLAAAHHPGAAYGQHGRGFDGDRRLLHQHRHRRHEHDL